MIEEIRISSLGVIESSTLELGPGFTVVTGETGAGKTMLVTGLGLLLGGRADSGAVRTGARQARVEGVVALADLPAVAAAVDEVGGEVDDDAVVLARNVSAEGRSRAFVGGAAVPVGTLGSLAESLVAVHGQSDQHRLLAAQAQRDALDRFGGAGLGGLLADYRSVYRALRACEQELDALVTAARERAREADLLRFGVGEVEAVSPQPGEDADLAAEEARLGYADTLRGAAEQAREALSSDTGDGPDALTAVAAARGLLDGVRDHDPAAGELPDLPGLVVHRGWDHPRVVSGFHHALAAVLPSEWPDPCPTTVLEAMALGAPLVTTHEGGIADMVDPEHSALVVPAGDPAALAAALVRVSRDETLRDRLREGARVRVRDFVQSRVAERFEGIYADVVARARAAS